MRIVRTNRFKNSYQKLVKSNRKLEKQITKTVILFSQNQNHPSLRLHKLRSSNYWSISVNMSIRIVFVYEENVVLLLDIGDHSIYD